MKKTIYSITLHTKWNDSLGEWHSWLQSQSAQGREISLNTAVIEGGKVQEELYELLQLNHWLLVSLFTTYQHFHTVMITRDVDLAAAFEEAFADVHYDSTQSSGAVLSGCRSTSFDDYGTESLLISEMLEVCDEEALLLCQNTKGMETIGRKLFHSKSAYHLFSNAREALTVLPVHTEFCAKDDEFMVNYSLYSVTNSDVLYDLFANLDSEYSFSPQLLAADTDIKQLKALLEEDFHPCPVAPDKLPGSWWYGHIYGGGSDEYHGVFSAKDARLTQWVWQAAGRDAFSLF